VEVSYIAAHYDRIVARQPGDGWLPFMHLGEFDAPGRLDDPVTEEEFERAQRLHAERVVALARIPPRGSVLEVGCGFGGNVALVDALCDVRRIVGMDVGSRQLHVAARRVRSQRHARIDWVHADATRLPFADSTFDVVFTVEAAFHFSSRRQFAAEAARVLTPNGRLVLTDIVGRPPSGTAEWPAEIRLLADVVQADMGPFPDPFGAEGTWRAIADGAGLDVAAHEDMTPSILPNFSYMIPRGVEHPSQCENRNLRSAVALRGLIIAGVFEMQRWLLQRR
jgi:SAM-dependent methyltransferase